MRIMCALVVFATINSRAVWAESKDDGRNHAAIVESTDFLLVGFTADDNITVDLLLYSGHVLGGTLEAISGADDTISTSQVLTSFSISSNFSNIVKYKITSVSSVIKTNKFDLLLNIYLIHNDIAESKKWTIYVSGYANATTEHNNAGDKLKFQSLHVLQKAVAALLPAEDVWQVTTP